MIKTKWIGFLLVVGFVLAACKVHVEPSGADSSGEDNSWYGGNSGVLGQNGSHQVGKKKANTLGIFDMSGNVWEWCYDRYNDSVLASDNGNASVTNPLGAESGSNRVIRGGNGESMPRDCSVCTRFTRSENVFGYYFIGFRVVRTAP